MSEEKLIASNRRAGRDYFVLDRFEAGIALQGTEVKSLRESGSMTLKDSYIDVRNGQMFMVGTHIRPYDQGNINNHEPERDRKLLMHKREILKLKQRVEEKGQTIVPLRVYFKKGRVKVEVGLCKGKHSFDKRAAIKEREIDLDTERELKQRLR